MWDGCQCRQDTRQGAGSPPRGVCGRLQPAPASLSTSMGRAALPPRPQLHGPATPTHNSAGMGQFGERKCRFSPFSLAVSLPSWILR